MSYRAWAWIWMLQSILLAVALVLAVVPQVAEWIGRRLMVAA